MRIRSRIAPFALTVVVLGGGLAMATPATAAVQSCYGSAKNYTTVEAGMWPGGGTWAYTTSNCGDINVKPTTTRRVRVCWKKTGTCNAYRPAAAGQWTVAASDVLDGTGFSLDFEGIGVSRGQYAA